MIVEKENIGQINYRCEEEMISRYGVVFTDKLGLLKGFIHKIVLKHATIPMVHNARTIPNLMRKPLQEE